MEIPNPFISQIQNGISFETGAVSQIASQHTELITLDKNGKWRVLLGLAGINNNSNMSRMIFFAYTLKNYTNLIHALDICLFFRFNKSQTPNLHCVLDAKLIKLKNKQKTKG